MEQTIKFIIDTLFTIITSCIYYKLKSHSSTGNRNSGFELDVNIKFSKK